MPLKRSEIADANGGHSPAQKLFGRPIREQDAMNRTRREENGRNRKQREQDGRRRSDDARKRSDDDVRGRNDARPGHGATTTIRTELSRILIRNRKYVQRRKSITAGGGGGRRDAESANPTLTPEQQANAAMSDFGADHGPPKPTNTGAVGTSQSRRSKRASKPPERLQDEPYWTK